MHVIKTCMKDDAVMFYCFDFCKEYNKIGCSVTVIFLQNCHLIRGLNMSGH